jgi:hypothetical protein
MKKNKRRMRQKGGIRKSEVRIRKKKLPYKAPTKTNKSDGPTHPMSER